MSSVGTPDLKISLQNKTPSQGAIVVKMMDCSIITKAYGGVVLHTILTLCGSGVF